MDITYEIEDGYVGQSAPQTVDVPDSEILDCDTEAEVEDLINGYVVEDFNQNIYPMADTVEAIEFWKEEKDKEEEETDDE